MSTGRAALALLTLAGLGLRVVHLTRFELFVDEAATWWFARLTAAGRLAEQMSLEPTPPLYYGLVGVLMRLFGESDLVMRLPSAVFGAAAIPAVFALGRELFSARVGWLAALLVAVHPLHVFYSREARVYTLLMLLTALLWLALWRALSRDTTRAWGLFAAVLAAACYSHFFGLFLGLATVPAILLWGRGRARRRGLAAAAAAGLAFAPYLLLTLPHLSGSGAAWSVETFYRDLPREKHLGRVLEMQLLGADYHPYLRQLDRPPTPPPIRWAAIVAQLGLLAWGLAGARRSGQGRAWGFLLLAWWVPIIVPWGITHGWRAIFHSGRHDVYTLGPVCALLAVGLAGLLFPDGPALPRLARRIAATAVVAALFSGAAFRLVSLHAAPATERHRAAGAWIAEHTGPEDRVIATGIRRLVSQHYARLGDSEAPFESFPRSTDDHPGWSDVMTLMEDEPALHREAGERVAALTASPPETVFLLLRRYERTADAVSATWLVDRHLLENLWHAGWSEDPELSAADLGIAAYRPPAAQPPEETP